MLEIFVGDILEVIHDEATPGISQVDLGMVSRIDDDETNVGLKDVLPGGVAREEPLKAVILEGGLIDVDGR